MVINASSVPPLALEESIRRIGCYAWTEMRLFEVVGGWVASVADAGLRVRFSAESHHFGWHAELWQQQLPQLHGRDPHDAVVPANPGVEKFFAELADPSDPARALEKAVGLYRVVLPRLVTAYSHHLAETAPVSDGPARRWLRIVIDDHLADWRSGEQLVEALLAWSDGGGAHDIERAAARQAQLEAMVGRAGGIVGEQEDAGR